ncbi:MAG TPA: chloride channel protein [Solirubrobacterales bacterium]|nr:chloride channel protein [Solirubrobacterales bacterium]
MGDDRELDADSLMRDRRFVVLLALAAIVGVIASLAAFGFLKLLDETQGWVYDDLPDALGYDSAPTWWSLPVLAIAGLVVACAVALLPGRGGHVPAHGLNPEPTPPIELPGVLLAAFATIGLGLVLGPEAPLIALGGGLGFLAIRLLRPDAPGEVSYLVAASGTFAALSFLFGSPVIAAVLLIEATGLGGPRLRLVLIPGLLAAGIGSLVSTGIGSWTGVDTGEISLEPLSLPHFPRPELVDFLWTVPLAAAVALVTVVIFTLARSTERVVAPRPFVALPVAGIAVAALAIAFSEITDKGVDQVLFSGETAVGPLVSDAGAWSLSALALLIGFKGFAYAVSLGSFRGGPVFPALFLGAAGGLMAAQLPGFEITPAVAVGIGAAVVAVLRLPLSAVVLATLLTFEAGLGVGPLIIVGVVVAHLTTLAVSGGGGVDASADQPAAESRARS